jgi:hypothetical protein
MFPAAAFLFLPLAINFQNRDLGWFSPRKISLVLFNAIGSSVISGNHFAAARVWRALWI